jgi:hypothetical protein
MEQSKYITFKEGGKQMAQIEGRLPNGETPYIGFGWLKLRLPFVHYKWSMPETVIGFMVVFVLFAAKPLCMNLLGMTDAQANTVVFVQILLYVLHPLLGDALVAGWVSPMIPLILAFVGGYEMGPERAYALIAVQMWFAVFCLGLGLTGLAGPVVRKIPVSIRAGIILGAGLAALMQVFMLKSNPRFIMNFPIGLTVGMVLACYFVWSYSFIIMAKTNKILKALQPYGLPIAFVGSAVAATLFGEIPLPKVVTGITPFDFSGVIEGFTIIGLGIPPWKIFLDALPLAFLVYVAAYGDMLFGDQLVKICDSKREDETIIPDPNRVHFVTGLRNFISCFVSPTPTMSGPYWTPLTAIVADRHMKGRETMDSIFSGFGSIQFSFVIAALIAPVWSVFSASLGLILAVCFVAVAFVAAYMSLSMVKYVQQKIVTIATAVVLASLGPIQALAIGFGLYFVLEFRMKAADRLPDVEVELINQ